MGGKPAGQRNFLSREIILEAAFRIVDADETKELTMFGTIWPPWSHLPLG